MDLLHPDHLQRCSDSHVLAHFEGNKRRCDPGSTCKEPQEEDRRKSLRSERARPTLDHQSHQDILLETLQNAAYRARSHLLHFVGLLRMGDSLSVLLLCGADLLVVIRDGHPSDRSHPARH